MKPDNAITRMMIIDNFCIKLRAYPNLEQREKIDSILNGLRVAYNVTVYEITQGNPLVTKVDKKDENVRWPDFSLCAKKEWLDCLRESHEQVKCVPSTALSSSAYGIFSVDMKQSWENYHPPMCNKAVKLPCGKWKPQYYSKARPRMSFTVQTRSSGFTFIDESKTVKIRITNVGLIKTRGWRFDLRFGDEQLPFAEAFAKSKKAFGVTVSKDNCGDYWLIVKLQTVWLPDKPPVERKPLGIDVGIKDVAITSEGDKYENKHFAKQEKRHVRRLSRKLSRRQGWANEEFRAAHKANKELQPSKGYEKAKLKLAKVHRKIAWKRANYNDCVSKDIVDKAEFIGIESLNVKGMMSNKHLAYALADVAMYDLLNKIKYKAERQGIPVVEIGQWEPSSQICHVCGYKNPAVKNLSVREWTCPECGCRHDRDVNAAINILAMASASRRKE